MEGTAEWPATRFEPEGGVTARGSIPLPSSTRGDMSRGRAYRRMQEKKVKRKVHRLFEIYWEAGQPRYNGLTQRMETWEPGSEMVGRFASTHFCPCSCSGCGNPRKHFGAETRQELKSALKEAEQRERAHSLNKKGQGYPSLVAVSRSVTIE